MTTPIPPDTIATYFDADANGLTDAKFMALVVEMRRRRSIHAAEEAAKALAPKRAKATAQPTTTPAAVAKDVPASEIDLDDLL